MWQARARSTTGTRTPSSRSRTSLTHSRSGGRWRSTTRSIGLTGLEPNAPPLPFPHTSQVEGELRELRCHFGSAQYRILYRRSGNLFVLLHAFHKTTATIPQHEIQVAKQRWQHFKRRMDAPRRRKPRAAGHDAP